MISDEQALNNIAANVERLLQDRGLNQSQLARMIGSADIVISRIVRGTTMPGAGIIARIAEAFDVSADRLVGLPPRKLSEIPEMVAK